MLYSGAVILCLVSIAASFAWGRVKNVILAVLCALIFPVIMAWPIYWIPLIGVTDKSEYSAWFGVFLIFWLIPATPVSVGMTLWVRHRSKRDTRHAG
jgi:hypothetical protein